MENKASITALMSAYGRAYHTEHVSRPVFSDRMAKQLMTPEEYLAMGNYILGGLDFFAPEKKDSFSSDADALDYLINTQIAPTPLARARFCEDSLRTAMLTGTTQYVILGAGLDTFALRSPEFLTKYDVFEADHPLTQADKKERIVRSGLTCPERLHFVPVDFSEDNLEEKLLEAGFDPNKKTFFSWLGVSYYLTTEQISRLLASLARLSAQGSSLVFDFGDEGLFTSNIRRVQNMVAMAAAGGEPMPSCFSVPALESLLAEHGFLLYERLTPEDIQQRFFTGQPKTLTAFPHICYANATLYHKKKGD